MLIAWRARIGVPACLLWSSAGPGAIDIAVLCKTTVRFTSVYTQSALICYYIHMVTSRLWSIALLGHTVLRDACQILAGIRFSGGRPQQVSKLAQRRPFVSVSQRDAIHCVSSARCIWACDGKPTRCALWTIHSVSTLLRLLSRYPGMQQQPGNGSWLVAALHWL